MQCLMKFHQRLLKILRKQNVTDERTDGWTDERTDNVKTVYPTTNTVCGGIIIQISASYQSVERLHDYWSSVALNDHLFIKPFRDILDEIPSLHLYNYNLNLGLKIEPRREKTGFFHIRKQRRRSASR